MNNDLLTIATVLIVAITLFGYMAYLLMSGSRSDASHQKSTHEPMDAAKTLKSAKKLMDAARAGNYEAVQSIVSDVVPKGFLYPHIANLLALGLFEAASNGHTKTVVLLADYGANMDRPHAENGVTAIGIAAYGGHDEIVQFLARRAADVNAKSNDGATPLMFAAGKCSVETVSALLAAGADPSDVSEGGLTAVDFATMPAIRDDVIALLKSTPNVGINTEGLPVGFVGPVAVGGECVEEYAGGGYRARVLTDIE